MIFYYFKKLALRGYFYVSLCINYFKSESCLGRNHYFESSAGKMQVGYEFLCKWAIVLNISHSVCLVQIRCSCCSCKF